MTEHSEPQVEQRSAGTPDHMKPPYLQSAITSLICGAAGVIFALVPGFGIMPGIAAVILGHFALHKFKTIGSPRRGRGLAITGLVTGYLSIVWGFLFAVIVFSLVTNGQIQ